MQPVLLRSRIASLFEPCSWLEQTLAICGLLSQSLGGLQLAPLRSQFSVRNSFI